MKSASRLLNFSRLTVIASAAVLLCACGQRGPLIHPDKDAAKYNDPTKKQTPAPAAKGNSSPAVAPSSESGEPASADTAIATPSAPSGAASK